MDEDGEEADRGEDRERRKTKESRGWRGRDVVLVSVTRPMPLKEAVKEYVNCPVDYLEQFITSFVDSRKGRERERKRELDSRNLIYYNFSCTNVEFFGRERVCVIVRSVTVEDGETKGWRCSYCTADRSATPSNPSRTCPRRWNVEIGKRFLHFLLARGDFATWGFEIELASSGLREKIRLVLKIYRLTNRTYNRWMKFQSAN